MGATILRNRYRVHQRLGAGGVGSVFRVEELYSAAARDGGGAHLALKALFTGHDSQILLSSLRLEFRVLATLRHPLIARVHDFGSLPADSGLEGSEGRPGFFFTRDLIDGQDLEAHCEPLSVAQICQVCQHTAEVLDVLHRSGMVHGDFKPANVIVSDDGRPHLIDFGLVRTEGQSSEASGTAAYLAPEVLRGKTIDRRIDLYALGISIYQLVTRRVPLPGANLAELVSWHLDGPPLRPSDVADLPEPVPVELDRLVQRLTNRDPDQRYPSAAEAAMALAEAVERAGAPAVHRHSLFVPPAPGENLTAPLVELEAAVRNRAGRSGGPALVAVVGDPGAGKTTLLQELAWRNQLSGVEVIRATFRSGDPRAFGALGDLLDQVAGLVGTSHPLEAKAAGSADRYALFQQISDYLAQATVPLLLLLDNGEQADEESRAALRFIAHTLHADDAVMLVVAFRTDEELWRQLGTPPQKRLAPLSGEDASRMVASASGRHDQQLASRIHTHTGGNPQFMMEALQRLGEAGWPASPDLKRLAPPRGLEEAVTGRLAELTPAEGEVLETLAVLGRPATGLMLMEVLEALQEQERPLEQSGQVGLPLERLEQLGWLDRSPDGAFTFRQGPTARILYQLADAERRRRLHLAVTRVLGRDAGDRSPVEWTRHAVGAGELELALESLDEATATLTGLGAHRRAIQLYEGVAALLPPDAERLGTLQRELGELHYTVGDYEQASAALERARAAGRGRARQLATIALAKVLTTSGEAERALTLIDALLEAEVLPKDRLSALAEAASAHFSLDAYEQVLETVERALHLMDDDRAGAADLEVRAELRGLMALSLGYLQRFERAGEEFEAALNDARAGDDRRVEANILNRWAMLAMRKGDLQEVPQRFGAALEVARQTGNVERMAVIQLNLAAFHLHRGDYAACLAHLPESLRLFEAMGAQKNLAAARCNMGYLELKLGLFEQARATLEKAVDETRQTSWRSGEALAVLLSALVNARRFHRDLAREGIAEARRLSRELGQHRDAADALLDLAELELDEGRLERATAAIQRARGEVELDSHLDLKVRAAAIEARAVASTGSDAERQAAAEALARALDDAAGLDAPELTWQCHAAAMTLAEARGQPGQAAQHAVAAATILGRMAADLPSEIRAAFWQDERRRAVRDRAALHQRAIVGASMPEKQDTPAPVAAAGPVDPASDLTLPVISTTSDHQILAHVTQAEERFYRLLEIYRQVNSELDPERLLGLVMDTAVELTGAEKGFLLLGSSAPKLKVEVARNLDLDGETGAYSRSIAEQVFTSGQPVITLSARNDPRFKEFMSVHQLQLESVLCIPIHARGKTAGVLYMESRFATGRFTPADQRLLMAFGDQVALALTNARLLSDNIRKAEELEQANEQIAALAEERGRLLSQRTLQLEEARRDLAETRRQLRSQTGRFGMVGHSPAMLKLFQLVERVAATNVPVLVEGESGTGKEMVARAIHTVSDRKKARLVSVNCAAIPENLLESELFGHVRGAFTGADRERKGLFAAAHGGTLFLDEIGDMPMRMQVDLLRALQEKTIRPVGAQQDIKVDVRVIAASNKSLVALVQQNLFREDLYYRLNVVTLKIPALRQRADDIPLLVEHFLKTIATQMKVEQRKLTKRGMHLLMEYGWPGNVRQLEHTLMNACVLADSDVLDMDDFSLEAPTAPTLAPVTGAPLAPVHASVGVAAANADSGGDRKDRERQQIMETLEACNWNKSKAAQQLGIPRRTFYRRLKEYQIN
jgi:transcriptional regulator with GAF, ATPase, and Fis domain